MFTQAMQERMETTAWSLDLVANIVFQPGRTTPQGYQRLSHWHRNFMPRRWHEDISELWRCFFVRMQVAIGSGNQVLFNHVFVQMRHKLGEDEAEFIHHLQDYATDETMRDWVHLHQRCICGLGLLPQKSAPKTEVPGLVLHSCPALVRAAIAGDRDRCTELCRLLIAKGAAALIAETIQRQLIAGGEAGNDTLIPIAMGTIGLERYEKLLKAAADRIEGVSQPPTVLGCLEALYERS